MVAVIVAERTPSSIRRAPRSSRRPPAFRAACRGWTRSPRRTRSGRTPHRPSPPRRPCPRPRTGALNRRAMWPSSRSSRWLKSGRAAARRLGRHVSLRLRDRPALEQVEPIAGECPLDVARGPVHLLAAVGEATQLGEMVVVEAQPLGVLRRHFLLDRAAVGERTDRHLLEPRHALEHLAGAATRKRSGIMTRDDDLAEAPATSITRSSAPLIGFCVNITPAVSGASSAWTTTPTLGRSNRPVRWRYVIAESEFADHQICAAPTPPRRPRGR